MAYWSEKNKEMYNLFHKLWGNATESINYNKADWKRFNILIEEICDKNEELEKSKG